MLTSSFKLVLATEIQTLNKYTLDIAFYLPSASRFSLHKDSKIAKALSHFNGKTCFLTSGRSNRHQRYGPIVVSVAQNQSYWASIDEDIETYLKNSIQIKPPESVFEPMHYLTFAAQKTTAPALCVAACELVGGDLSQAMAAASAIHLMHAAAYTHEHLPLTDRFRPNGSLQHRFNPGIELLTGDGMIPFGIELLARSVNLPRSNQGKILRVIVEITRATGSLGTVSGRYHEVLKEDRMGNDADVTEYVCRKKEGELHGCGAACGAILGGGDEEEIEKLRKFWLYFGMIQGMLGKMYHKQGMEKNIEELKALAAKELEIFHGKKIEPLSGLVASGPWEENFCCL